MARSKGLPVRASGRAQVGDLRVEEVPLSPLRRGLVTQAWLRLALTSPGDRAVQGKRQVRPDEDTRL